MKAPPVIIWRIKFMLTAHHITKSFGVDKILDRVTFSVNWNDRVGLIGPNGSGKTTLLRILLGEEVADSGHVTYSPKLLRIGYLSQGFEHPKHLTIRSLLGMRAGDPDYLQDELSSLADELSRKPENNDIQQRYDNLLERINRFDSKSFFDITSALGLYAINQESSIGELSGGQKTRLALAIVLLSDPQILLLDEPTNHLDIRMLEWLEEWLSSFQGGALIVSHDRMFLDQTVTRILDINPEEHSVRLYDGNYSDYMEQYIQEREKQTTEYRDQVYQIRRMRADIARTKQQAKWVETTTTPRNPGVRRIAKKVAAKAKSREKKLDRYIDSDDRVEKPKLGWQLKLEFDKSPRLGREVLSLTDLVVGYRSALPLLNIPFLVVQAGQRVAITGENGSGKTTLLRTIMGLNETLDGTVRRGATVRLGYMAQEQEILDGNISALETIQHVSQLNETEARSFLHYFLFTKDDPLRLVEHLSFGERARLELAILIASGSNLLLLDEPINHLDIPSREMFEQALATFPGTILAVVHDRYFISRFATDLWIVEDGAVDTRIMRSTIQ